MSRLLAILLFLSPAGPLLAGEIGMAGVPARAGNAEKALLGQPWTRAGVERALAALASDYEPITDWRASREYRMAAAQNLVLRFYLDTTGDEPVQLLAGGLRS